jgi:elongation factor Ts
MAEISAKDVAALRKATSAGMMDCKRALEESDGDIEAAKLWLREKGLANANKRGEREANEGAVDVVIDGDVGAIVEVNCETDFVAKGDVFKQTVTRLAQDVVANGKADTLNGLIAPAELEAQPFDGSTIGDTVKGLSGTLREKIELGRVVRFVASGGLLDSYKHVQNERGVIGVLVELGGVDNSNKAAVELAHDIALHIAHAAPRYTRRDDVPPAEVDQERAVYEAQAREEGKPEQALAKIVEGKLNGYYKTVVLLEQPFVKDNKNTVGALVEQLGAGATVKRFARVKIGEE